VADRRAPRAKLQLAVAGGAVVLAAVGVGAYFLVSGSSSHAKGVAARSYDGHEFLEPECEPFTGVRWRYPGPARIQSSRYELFAIDYSCTSAETWARRLAARHIPFHRSGAQSKLQGPDGFYCSGLADAQGRAYAGGCQKGNSAFAWNWNVANSRQVLVRDETGKYHIEKVAGSDTETIIRPLKKGHVQVYVLNTSGIGFVNGFTWTPPPGWKIKAITKAKGGTCKLAADGNLACRGRIAPPSCLCASDGGAVTIDLEVSAPASSAAGGHRTSFGAVGAKLHITRMTPVPYLIPGTPKEAKRQHGV
jgi:hypothetical protein